jgi:ribose 5-phosphate isomerase B
MPERVLLASAHADAALVSRLRRELQRHALEVRDLATTSASHPDHADFALPLAQQVSEGVVHRGVLLCGTGLGMTSVANRHPKVRAAVCWSPETAALARRHDDANVLVLPTRFLGTDDAIAITNAWLETPFEDGQEGSFRSPT